ncbi:hypothetical protein [Brucella intermedia]|uniref:hypothetical protein n=1 Tax=Brucella intermedia TaxID=94625 RepID=UPI0023609284|nr:hypothetical protein [Brucella intermedia]
MSKIETGGPAFPNVGSHGNIIEPGMTLRDYFAAQAPSMPSDYMIGEYPILEDIERPDGYWDWGTSKQAEFERSHETEKERFREEHRVKVTAYEMNRRVTWALAYADAMLAARGGDRD